jgi:hypothetical protein
MQWGINMVKAHIYIYFVYVYVYIIYMKMSRGHPLLCTINKC